MDLLFCEILRRNLRFLREKLEESGKWKEYSRDAECVLQDEGAGVDCVPARGRLWD